MDTAKTKYLKHLYWRVIEEPNKNFAKNGLIICPECGKEIFLLPRLRLMNVAIENHVCFHKNHPSKNPIITQQKAISIRISLMEQVLRHTYHSNYS